MSRTPGTAGVLTRLDGPLRNDVDKAGRETLPSGSSAAGPQSAERLGAPPAEGLDLNRAGALIENWMTIETMHQFRGFPADATRFFADLAANNTKAWFEENRARFEASVRAPLIAFTESLPAELRPAKLYRLHRDIRFSKDKSPYKLMQGAVLGAPGGSMTYCHLSKDGLLVAAGQYMMSPEQIAGFRASLDLSGSARAFNAAIEALKAAGIALEPGGAEPLKRVPAGFAADHAMGEWLRWKGCVAMHTFPADQIMASTIRESVLGWFKAAEPLKRWLDHYVP